MKFAQLFVGLLLGGLLGFGLTQYISKSAHKAGNNKTTVDDSSTEDWSWPDSLDAVKAAPKNHKTVYEDDNVRILAVILDGRKSEPIHTHKWKSVMWIAEPIVPCQINNYSKSNNGDLVLSDSVVIKDMPVNIGQLVKPEGPTSTTNLGPDNGVAYRVEFKKDFVR